MGLTCNIEMFHVDTPGHNFKEGNVADVGAALHLQVPELGAPPGDGVQPLICQFLTAVQVDPLDNCTDCRRLVAEALGQGLDGPVGLNLPGVDPDGGPQRRVPHQVVPASAHPGTPTLLVTGQTAEDQPHDVIRHNLKQRNGVFAMTWKRVWKGVS